MLYPFIQLFLLLLIGVLLFVLIMASLMYTIFTEKDYNYDPNSKFIDLCYYVIISITNTGYGDITPKTIYAKLFSSLLVLSFYLMLFTASIVGILPSLFSSSKFSIYSLIDQE